VTGIEPAFRAWEARVLPLNYTRVQDTLCPIQSLNGFGMGRRTAELVTEVRGHDELARRLLSVAQHGYRS
jgi:hypothetical protein